MIRDRAAHPLVTPAGAAPSARTSWTSGIAGPLALVGFLALTLGIFAVLAARASSSFYLEIPMRSVYPQQTRLFYQFEHQDDAVASSTVDLPGDNQPVNVRFPLGRGTIAALIFDPTIGDGEVDIGAPTLRCNADRWLHWDVIYQSWIVQDYRWLHQIADVKSAGAYLHIIPTPHADVTICGINLAEPLKIGFSAEAFIRLFVPVAFVWTFFVLLGCVLRSHLHACLLRLTGRPART